MATDTNHNYTAAGDWRTPLRLAMLRALAVTSGLMALGAFVGLVWQYLATDALVWALVGAVAAFVLGTFAAALWGYTGNLQWALWQIETETGEDLDGDGQIGQPERPRVRLMPLTAGGQKQEPVAWVDDTEENEPTPIIDGFDLDVVDVAAFLAEAGRRGLTAAAWLKPGQARYKLPSGVKVSRGVWERATRELLRLGWAENTGGGLVMTRKTPELLRQLEAMI